jgi:apolipoprotein N-acyltransferase
LHEQLQRSPAGPDAASGALSRLAGRTRGLAGWRRVALSLLLGALATLAMPPVQFVPALFISFTGLVWQVEGAHGTRWHAARRAFAIGWWFGVAHFATGLYWISHALLVDAAKFGWLIPFVILGLSAGLAVFPGLAAMVLRLANTRGITGVLVLAVAWGAGEWVRGHVFTGFPWNLTGTAWTGLESMMQPAALFGLYGLSMLTVLVAAAPASLAGVARGARRWAPAALAGVLLAVWWAAGMIRLLGAPGDVVPGVRLRLVQPDIPQSLKWDPALRERHVLHTIQLTRQPGYDKVTHVIWPEAAVPFPLSNDAALRQAIATVVPPNGLLMTGAPRIAGEGRSFQVWNSLYALDGSGAIVGLFDKFHLVPLGEYVPLRGILPLEKITHGMGDFSAGPGPRTVPLPGLPPVSPLICYEVIFPGEVVEPGRRAGWLLNVTNDAWFGISSGPYQHFATARFRAVEEGLPLARAANNGISAVVDPYGRVIARLGLGEMGVLDADLPQALEPPLFARIGNFAAAALGMVLLALAAATRRLT